VPILLDPALQGEWNGKPVTLSLEDKPVWEILEALAAASGLEFDILHGLVVYAQPERLYGVFAKEGTALDGQDLPRAARAALAKSVNFDYFDQTPAQILEDAARRAGTKAKVDASAALSKAGPVRIRFERVSFRDILTILALAYGDEAAWIDGGAWVGSKEALELRLSQ
jgi:hypothetical protein